MAQVEWDEVDPRPAGSEKVRSLFLKFEAGKEYKIRPLGKPHEVIRYFISKRESADGENHFAISNVKGEDCIIQRNHRNSDGDPMYRQQVKYAINCLDRDDLDENDMPRIKVAELPLSVARLIRDWGKEMGIKPGSGAGADWKIRVEKTGSAPRDIKYHAMPLAQTPFTKQELAFFDKIGINKLEDIFKITSQDELEDKLGLADEGAAGSNGDDDFTPRDKTTAASSVDGDNFEF